MDPDSCAVWGDAEGAAGRWALRSPTGGCLSIKRGGDVVADADAVSPDDGETFSVDHRSEATIALLTADGAWLVPDPAGHDRLVASAFHRTSVRPSISSA